MGDHGISARPDHRDAAVRKARRPVRTPDRPSGRPGDLPPRIRPVRLQPEFCRVDRIPGVPRVGRRWPHGQRAGRHRRRGAAPSARSVPGPVRCGIRARHRDRALAGGGVDDQPLMALDLLHKPADRHPGARRVGRHLPVGGRSRQTPHRLLRCRSAGAEPGRAGPHGQSGRDHLRLVLRPDTRPGCPHPGRPGWLRDRRAAGQRTRTPSEAAPEPGLRDRGHRRAPPRIRHVRDHHIPPPLLSGGQGGLTDGIGSGPAPADGRPPDHVDRGWSDRVAHRPVPGVPDRRYGHHDPRALSPVAPVSRDVHADGLRVHVRDRLRDRPGHAGLGGRSTERSRLRGARRRNLGQYAVPQYRELGRHRCRRHHFCHRIGKSPRAPISRTRPCPSSAPRTSTRPHWPTCRPRCTQRTWPRSPDRWTRHSRWRASSPSSLSSHRGSSRSSRCARRRPRRTSEVPSAHPAPATRSPRSSGR